MNMYNTFLKFHPEYNFFRTSIANMLKREI